MKILSLIIQIIHLILIIVIPLIPLISNKYDILYTSLLFSIILNWNIFKGECILSYFENKSLDNKYKLGDNKPSSYKDVIDDIYPKLIMNINYICIPIVILRNYSKKDFYIILGLFITTGLLLINLKLNPHQQLNTQKHESK